MAFIPGTNVGQVNFIMTLEGQDVQNILYFEHDTAIDEPAATALMTYLKTWWDVELSAGLSNNLSLDSIRLTDLTTDSSPVYDYTAGLPVSGGAAFEALPNNDAFCVSFRTGGRGRSARGRNYLAGIPKVSVTNSVLSAPVANAFVAAYEEIPLAVPAGWTWVVASRYHNNAPRAAIDTRAVTNVLYTDLVIDSQRGRKPA